METEYFDEVIDRLMTRIVIVGAGQAGFQLAASLRQGGHRGAITLLAEEECLPYQRPPLSKTFLKESNGTEGLLFRPTSFYDKHAITLLRCKRVIAIDRKHHVVRLGDGQEIPYDFMAIATGARNRRLTVPGAVADGIFSLRSVKDAEQLRAALKQAASMAVIGGGFLGLEVAALALTLGLRVHVLEAGPRLMGRAVTDEVSTYFLDQHRACGMDIRLGTAVSEILVQDGRASGIITTAGDTLSANLILVAVGVIPNTELAADAGLPAQNGVIVNSELRTHDQCIFAIGDCARYPNAHANEMIRIESVQNAVDQARCAAANMIGAPTEYRALPWFWSTQAATRLQIAGFSTRTDWTIRTGDSQSFSIYGFRDQRLVKVESVNAPTDHMRARRLMMRNEPIYPDELLINDIFPGSGIVTPGNQTTEANFGSHKNYLDCRAITDGKSRIKEVRS